MKPTSFSISVLSLLLAFTVPVSAQTTVQADYKSSIEKATKAYDAKAWGECMRNLRQALQAALKQRTDGIRAAMPAAPAGMKFEDEEGGEAMFVVGMGSQVVRQYRADDERSISLKVQADYSMLSALMPLLTDPAVVRANKGEMLEYGKQKAVLTKQGDDGKQWGLQIMIDSQHLVEVVASGFDRAALLKVFDEAAVAKLAKELMN